MISLTVDRVTLSLPALVFSTPDTGLWVESLRRPAKRWRREYASSRNLHGDVLLRATLEHASIAGTLYVQADTTAALRSRMDEVEAAFGQFFYPVAIDEDGQADTYNADPADVDWGEIDSGMSAAFMAATPITIPVYPIASA